VVLLGEEFGRIDGVESAFSCGSFAARLRGVDGPSPPDIDVIAVGNPDVDVEACARVEAAVHRPLSPTILAPAEFGEWSCKPARRSG
jgi:hypothetical protein